MKILEKYVLWRMKMWPYDPQMCAFYDIFMIILGCILTMLAFK